MRLFLPVVIVFALLLNSEQPQDKPRQPQQATTTDQRGTQESPIVVKVLPTTKTPEEAAEEKKDRDAKTENDGNLVILTGVLAFVGFCQLLVYGYQAKKLRETVESAGEQAEAMERHIGEAARSADAMERIATTIQAGNRAIIRAYLTVIIGGGIYQERRPGQGDLKFEARPSLVNTGNTPARKVRIMRRKAQILPVPLPGNFDFPLPDDDPAQGDAVVGAHLTYILNCIVDDFVPDAEVQAIKEGAGRGLYVWGLVTYEDIFGESHFTQFAQHIYWLPNNTVMGFFIPGHNDAD
jgi:hypothetical protein